MNVHGQQQAQEQLAAALRERDELRARLEDARTALNDTRYCAEDRCINANHILAHPANYPVSPNSSAPAQTCGASERSEEDDMAYILNALPYIDPHDDEKGWTMTCLPRFREVLARRLSHAAVGSIVFNALAPHTKGHAWGEVSKMADDITRALLAHPAPAQPERDGCKFCLGAKGGVPGNENVFNGIVVCDYCTVLLHDATKDPAPAQATCDGSGWVRCNCFVKKCECLTARCPGCPACRGAK